MKYISYFHKAKVSDGCFEREVEKLEQVQLESASIVSGLTQIASRDSLYYKTKVPTLFHSKENLLADSN